MEEKTIQLLGKWGKQPIVNSHTVKLFFKYLLSLFIMEISLRELAEKGIFVSHRFVIWESM
jgi:hypothetical protein